VLPTKEDIRALSNEIIKLKNQVLKVENTLDSWENINYLKIKDHDKNTWLEEAEKVFKDANDSKYVEYDSDGNYCGTKIDFFYLETLYNKFIFAIEELKENK
jgi:hypothetical protein